ncbi:MAG: methyl-accepting chemotaxis protein [Oligoflexales bacterium]
MSLSKKLVFLIVATALALILVSMTTIYTLNNKIKVIFEEKLKNEKLVSLGQVIDSISNEISISFSNAVSEKIILSLENDNREERSNEFGMGVFGVANLLNSSYGLRQISVFSGQTNSIITSYSLKKEEAIVDVNSIKKQLRKSLENEQKSVIQVSTNEGSYFASLLPGENEDEEISYVYILIFPIETVTNLFYKKIGNPSYFSNDDNTFTSEDDSRAIEKFIKNSNISGQEDSSNSESILTKDWVKKIIDLDTNDIFLKDYKFIYFSDETALIAEVNYGLLVSSLTFLMLALLMILVVVFMVKKISRSIEIEALKLVESSESIRKSSRELSKSSKSLADLNSEQSDSITLVASSVEQVAAMVKNNLNTSEKSQEVSNLIYETTQGGCQLNSELLDSVDQLSKSNQEIKKLVDIIGKIGEKTQIIDEIVFQTRLLSFNASVEAERAGEHGRGFSVVAQEVSSLAKSSGKASSEIGSIVKNSIKEAQVLTNNNDKKVSLCLDIVNKTSALFEKISESSDLLKSNGEQILAASKEQSLGVSQIADSMSRLDEGTQRNESAAKNNSSEAERLDLIAISLTEIVSRLSLILYGSKNKDQVISNDNDNDNDNVHSIQRKLNQEIKNEIRSVTSQNESNGEGGWARI